MNQPPPVETIGERAADQAEDSGRQELEGEGDPEIQRRAGKLVNEQRNCNRAQSVAGVARNLPEIIEREIARSEDGFQCAEPIFRCHPERSNAERCVDSV